MRPRVLHVGKYYPPFRGGMETHLHALCTAIRDRVDVQVVVASETRHTMRSLVDEISVTRAGTAAVIASTPICIDMVRALRSTRSDIVHLHHPNPMAFAAYAVSGHRGRLVVTYHSDIVQQRVLSRAFAPLLTHVLSRADAIIATSQNYLASSPMLRRYARLCTVIPLGTRTAPPPAPSAHAVARIRAEFGDRIVLSVGRLVYYKGLEHLIRAMRTVDARLLIIGDGPLRATLEALAVDCGVQQRVTFLGAVDDVTSYYHAADVYALPSCERSEAFGMTQVEAMASGTPVVNTRLGTGVESVSLHDVTGITVLPADADALAAALNTMLDDDAMRRRFGTAAKARAAAEYSEELMADRTIDLYHRVLRRTGARAMPVRGKQTA